MAVCAQGVPRFREHEITSQLKVGYQLVAADLNGDGRKDLIAVDEGATELAWFENPSWQRHVLALDVPRPLNVDCWDVDGDGVPEVVLAYRFDPNPEKSVGNVVLLKSGKDVRKPWTSREIDRVPTAHRVRWIDPEGDGKKVLLVAPIVGRRFPPLLEDPAPIYLYRPGPWKRETLSSEPRGILHAIYRALDGRGNRWAKTVLDDGGIAGADCIIDDFTGDGKPDIVCIGASTHNLKLYQNLGK